MTDEDLIKDAAARLRTKESMPRIYVVQGSTGEYEDRCEWLVAAYSSKPAAEARVANATRRASELFTEYGNIRKWRDAHSQNQAKGNEYDEDMQVDYNGVEYCVLEVVHVDGGLEW